MVETCLVFLNMKKLKIIILLSFFSLCLSCKKDKGFDILVNEKIIVNELIDGPANVRESINGNLIFTLNDDANVNVIGEKNNWFIISVFIDSLNISNNLIKKEDTIYQNSKAIGKMYENLNTYEFYSGSHFIEGYTHKKNIKNESLIESVVSKNLNNRNLEDWNRIIKRFGFENRNGFLHYKAFEILENNDISPGFRILLLFENKNLIGIYHSREIQYDLIESYDLNYDKISFYKDFDTVKKKELIKFIKKFQSSAD